MKVFESKQMKHVRSENYNYDFNKITGEFSRWGKEKKDDPEFSVYGPEIADVEISTICNQGCTYCFPAGELVNVNGKSLAIDEVTVGDVVESCNEDTKITEISKVITTHKHEYSGVLICIKLENNKQIKCTPDHLIYVRKKGWIEAKYLKEDDDLIFEPL